MTKGYEKKPGDPFDNFITKCKKNLHLVLHFSPAGGRAGGSGVSQFSLYVRNYPSLVNCTTIDWFMPWPKEALEKVGRFYLSQEKLFEENELERVVSMACICSETSQQLADQYLLRENRRVY